MADEAESMKVSDMLRTTGLNTQEFMNRIADHIEKLEAENLELRERLANATNG